MRTRLLILLALQRLGRWVGSPLRTDGLDKIRVYTGEWEAVTHDDGSTSFFERSEYWERPVNIRQVEDVQRAWPLFLAREWDPEGPGRLVLALIPRERHDGAMGLEYNRQYEESMRRCRGDDD